MGKKKDAKEIARKLSIFMQENKYSIPDIDRGLVVLTNLEKDFVWSNGLALAITIKSKPVEMVECTT